MINKEYIRIWAEGNIMRSVYKVEEVNLDITIEMIAARLQACNGKPFPFLADVTEVKAISKEARTVFAGGDGIKLMTACALLVDSPVNRLLGNFFLSVSKPKVRTRLFTYEADVLKWLRDFTP